MNGLVYLIIWVFVLLLIVKWFNYKLPFWIGRNGEKFVSKKLNELDPGHYKVLNDLLFPSSGRTNTTQIDHVVVSNFGIFCIETKDYGHWIFGDANQDYWTQVIYKYRKRFYNPLHQNHAHIKAIEALVRPLFPNAPIISLVIFPKADKLEISGTDAVGNAGNMVSKILRYRDPVISDVDKNKIIDILMNADIKDPEVRKIHNKNAKALKEEHVY